MSDTTTNTHGESRLMIAATAARITIGWHFLYEGLLKVFDADWSSASYLAIASGPFATFFQGIATNSWMLTLTDFLTQWGLTAVGLGLMLGLLSRWASIGGMVLLALFYLSNPPFIGNDAASSYQGNYMIVNTHLIEIMALWVLMRTKDSKVYGLDRYLDKEKGADLSTASG